MKVCNHGTLHNVLRDCPLKLIPAAPALNRRYCSSIVFRKGYTNNEDRRYNFESLENQRHTVTVYLGRLQKNKV